MCPIATKPNTTPAPIAQRRQGGARAGAANGLVGGIVVVGGAGVAKAAAVGATEAIWLGGTAWSGDWGRGWGAFMVVAVGKSSVTIEAMTKVRTEAIAG